MKKALFAAGIAAVAAISIAGDSEIIIESFSDGFNADAFKQSVGKWSLSQSKSRAAGLRGTQTYYNDANTTSPGSARFTPNIPVAGKYEIYSTYPSSGNASGVVYKVVSADGEKVQNLDQYGRNPSANPPADQWFSLGTYSFKQGSEGYVEISDPQTGKRPHLAENNARVYADAVKLVPRDVKLPDDYANKIGGVAPTAVAAAPRPSAPASGAFPPLSAGTGAAPGLPPLPPSKSESASSLPALPGGASTGVPSIPSLPGAPSSSSQIPPLPGGSATSALPSLPGQGAPSGLPALPGGSATSGSGMPGLSAAAGSPAGSSMPALPAASEPAAGGALPALPGAASSAPSAGAGLPALPGSAPAALPGLPTASASSPGGFPALPTGTSVTPAASSMPAMPGLGSVPAAPSGTAPMPALPGLGSAAAPAPSTGSVPPMPGLPGLGASASNAPPPPPTGIPPMPQPGSAASLPGAPALPGMAPSSMPGAGAPLSGVPPMGDASAGAGMGMGGSNLQWSYDFGAALNQARTLNKRVFVFFVAKGNVEAIRYENEYFKNPAVRSFLDKYVLTKIDFPQNTRLGYALDIYGAGQIAITDPAGTKIGSIPQIPATPEDLIKSLEAIK